MNWSIVIISISVLLAAFAVFKEVRRPNRARLVLRIVAAMVAISALACLALPLTYQKEMAGTSRQKLIVLTPGFNADSLNNYAGAPICTFDTAVNKAYPKAKLVADVSQATADAQQRQLHLFGYGLRNDDLSVLQKSFVFHPSPQPNGLTAVHWTNNLKTGDRLQVQGHIKNSTSKKLKLVLNGLSINLDSVSIAAGQSQVFDLHTMPKHSCRSVYRLIGLSDNDTLFNEFIPVNIVKAPALKLLLLSSSPDFETKFLKNWLSNNGYAVASRSLITKGKYSQELVNIGKNDLSRLTANLLQKFDLLVSDVSSVSNLSPAENTALQNEISEKGLGLLIRADSADKLNGWFARGFGLGRLVGAPKGGALQIQGIGKLESKLIQPAAFLTPNTNQQVLVANQQGQAVAANALYGAGKIGVTLINYSYNWMLGGSKNDYSALWSAIINNMARKQKAENGAWLKPQLPVAGRAATLATVANLAINGTKVALKQDANVPFEHSGTYWPETPGWQQSMAEGKAFWWFAWPKGSWASIVAAEKLKATAAYAAAHPATAIVTKQIQDFERTSVPKIYFYILLLVALSFLWAEAKYTGY